MGKRERDEIFNAIDVVDTVINNILNSSKKHMEKDAISLLSECYECIVVVEEKIKKIHDEKLTTVKRLDTLREIFFVIKERVSEWEDIIIDLEEIQTKLEDLKKDLSKELKKEVIFLPYKASMWDSLESVWRAANEDEACVAKVIPIPYFDKNSDGSLGKMNWEGNQFPDYVPITSYEDYDLEEHHPDMIFIHNPYDECNFVTSIHPDYYSSRLKKYTDRLVYIPYFVLDEIEPGDLLKVKQKKHYCLTPGVFNSDYVIVQSEEMRQVYINILAEHFGENTRKKWENKVMGLGSPKDEKVLKQDYKDINVPKEWLQIIQKPDGTRRKIIFYNTSVGAFLKYRSKMLDKIEKTLKWFQDNSSEIALLWRPHPLYKSTIEAMAPELLERYEKIIDDYKEQGWGILDDTSDLERAITLSDAYYGDHSSVERLYQKLNKCVVFQNPLI